ncbi:MAG: Na+/H+ antiporter subunit E [Haloarculaceae archaeon]
MRKWPVVGVVLAVLWLFVRGVHLDARAILGEFLVGLAVGLPVAFLLRAFYTDRTRLARNLRVAPYAVLYGLVFLRELLTANLDVAYRVLSPSLPIEPDVVEVPLRVETDAAITTIANSITLTPGTLTMDYDEATNTLYVHGITGRDREAVLAPIRTWEDYALVLFDEEADPSTPAPRAGDRDGDDPTSGGDDGDR